MHNGLPAYLRDRLTVTASLELDAILLLLQDVMLSDAPDDRFLHHGSNFFSRGAYSLLLPGRDVDRHARHIWSSSVPIKVKVFGWLLCRDRLNTRANLLRKTITANGSYQTCDHHLEDATP